MGKKYEVISEDVLHFPGYFEHSDDLVNFFESTISKSIPDWGPWFSGGEDDDPEEYGSIKYVEKSNIDLEDSTTKQDILSQIKNHDDAVVNAFLVYLSHIGTSDKNIKTIKSRHLDNRPPSFTLKKYHKGKRLGAHPDWGEKTPAVFTVAVYLSDNYRGGDLIFPDLDKKINLVKGSVVVFPSIFMHQSTEILEGLKYLTNEIVFVDVDLLDGRNVYAEL